MRLPPNVWVINRRHFNNVLRFAEAIGALDHLESSIAEAVSVEAASGRRVEAEIYPFERYGLEVLRFVATDDMPLGDVVPLGSVTLTFDRSALRVMRSPWRNT